MMVPSSSARPRRGRLAVTSALALVVPALVVTGCTQSDPTLLRASDFDGVASAEHDQLAQTYVPGTLWCERLEAISLGVATGPISRLTLDSEDPYPTVGAAVGDQGMDSLIDRVEDATARCAQPSDPGLSFEELSGLGDGVMGWRVYDGPAERWGEYALVPIDTHHVLLVGFETDQTEAPVEMDELIRLAREGVDRVGLDG